MSNQSQSQRRGAAGKPDGSTKAARRGAVQRAVAARTASRARLRKLIIGGASVGVVFVLIIVAVLVRGGSEAQPGWLPNGMDPALATKPATSAVTGDLTKLTVKILIEGKGDPVKVGQVISVNYVGVLYPTGQEFDASWKNGQPFVTPIGVGKVIKGWDQGLIGVKVGSRVQLDIPADLAYGQDAGEVSGPLRFIVDVLSAQIPPRA